VEGCTDLSGVVLTPAELAMPMTDAARAKARRALTDCGFVVLDNLIPADKVARVRAAYMKLRDSREGKDFKYPCQGEGRVEHMLPFEPPFNDSGVYDDPRLLQASTAQHRTVATVMLLASCRWWATSSTSSSSSS